MKALLEHIFLPNCENWVRCWVYTEADPHLGDEGTGL